jgi:hypothetical protein
MDNLEERLAVALFTFTQAEQGFHPPWWHDMDDGEREPYIRAARAAMKVLDEPAIPPVVPVGTPGAVEYVRRNGTHEWRAWPPASTRDAGEG